MLRAMVSSSSPRMSVPSFARLVAFPHISTTAGPGIIHSCYDDDTCTIAIRGLPSVFGDKLGLRLVGIDTPEMIGKSEEERAPRQASEGVFKQPSRIGSRHQR